MVENSALLGKFFKSRLQGSTVDLLHGISSADSFFSNAWVSANVVSRFHIHCHVTTYFPACAPLPYAGCPQGTVKTAVIQWEGAKLESWDRHWVPALCLSLGLWTRCLTSLSLNFSHLYNGDMSQLARACEDWVSFCTRKLCGNHRGYSNVFIRS